MLKLRGHHLICLHFFIGEGYDASFARNLKDILKRTGHEMIKVTEGADDVCRMCPYLKADICRYDDNSDREMREMDNAALNLLKVKLEMSVGWAETKKKISGIFLRWRKDFCSACDWKTACVKNHYYHEMSNL